MKAKRIAKIAAGTLAAALLIGIGIVAAIFHFADQDPFVPLYDENCSVCHGVDLAGAAQGTPLIGLDLKHGDSVVDITHSIAQGYPQKGMPAWSATLNDAQITSLAIYIAERRVGRRFTDFKVDTPLVIPQDILTSEAHNFRIETVATDLDPLPFSIAPLPDGRILLTEKKRGLSIISTDGVQSPLIDGTPETYGRALTILKLEMGLGWLLDVALHPDYENNGWVYLHHTHICTDCEGGDADSFIPLTMNRLIRGRIEENRWVDEEIIWQSDRQYYSRTPDLGAAGRTALDSNGYAYITVGIKGNSNFDGIQDLTTPYGKIHRVHDDGRIPTDNPFFDHADHPGALKTIWTYGHRSAQGLEFNRATQKLWSTEMGPRGGDEVNLILPGRNYGWPLTSKGLNYDGTPVEYGKNLGIEFDLDDIEQPIVDLTPSPAISSFIFYDGDLFPEWRGDIIVGSLKATELYRIKMDGDKAIGRERLVGNLGRIRDVEAGPDGAIYLLFEHELGGQIVRLVPDREAD
jgi:glucose/arabinose dehydrogenase